jgi:hypothetical protein
MIRRPDSLKEKPLVREDRSIGHFTTIIAAMADRLRSIDIFRNERREVVDLAQWMERMAGTLVFFQQLEGRVTYQIAIYSMSRIPLDTLSRTANVAALYW